MTTRNFFKMLETANKFKELCGELPTRIEITERNSWGYATTYNEFVKIVKEIYIPETAKKIIGGEIEPTHSVREFEIKYTSNGTEWSIKLFVE